MLKDLIDTDRLLHPSDHKGVYSPLGLIFSDFCICFLHLSSYFAADQLFEFIRKF